MKYSKGIKLGILVLAAFMCGIFAAQAAAADSDKAAYDKKMIDTIKMFSQKKEELSKKTRTEIEDILTIAATQAREKNYADATAVLDEIDQILSGKKKETKVITVENEDVGTVKSYKFDINKDDKIVSSADDSAAEEAKEEPKTAGKKEPEAVPTKAPSGKFSRERLDAKEQKLYDDLVNVLPKAEREFKMHQNPDNARRLMRLRRAFYALKKKGMGFSYDADLLNELKK